MSSHRGLNRAQALAVHELTKLCVRGELEVRVTGQGELDGAVRVLVRDRWAVEHYRIDPHGVITRPVSAGAAPPEGVPQV